MKPRVIILGGGLAGRATALALGRAARTGSIDLKIVDARGIHVDPTRLAAASSRTDRSLRAVVSAPAHSVPGAEIVTATVTGIEPATRTVTSLTSDRRERTDRYDQLVVCLGATTDDRGVAGVREHAFGFRTPADAVAIGEAADLSACSDGARGRIVVVGASLAGIALAGTLAGRLHRYGHPNSRIVLVDRKQRLLPGLHEQVGELAHAALGERGVEVRLDAQATSVTPESVALRTGGEIDAGLVVWAGGLRPVPAVAALPGEHTSGGRLVVDPYLAVRAGAGIWACGDSAAVPDLERGGDCAQTATHAVAQARRLAANILATLAGDYPHAYRREHIAELAVVGPGEAVGHFAGKRISGRGGWLALRASLTSVPDLLGRARTSTRPRAGAETGLPSGRHTPLAVAPAGSVAVSLGSKPNAGGEGGQRSEAQNTCDSGGC